MKDREEELIKSQQKYSNNWGVYIFVSFFVLTFLGMIIFEVLNK